MVVIFPLSGSLNSHSSQLTDSTFSTGPPDSKYCGDGGVYFTYNFWEKKSEGGGVGWPYGADKLNSSTGIELKVEVYPSISDVWTADNVSSPLASGSQKRPPNPTAR